MFLLDRVVGWILYFLFPSLGVVIPVNFYLIRRGNPKVVVMAVTAARQSRNGQIRGRELG